MAREAPDLAPTTPSPLLPASLFDDTRPEDEATAASLASTLMMSENLRLATDRSGH